MKIWLHRTIWMLGIVALLAVLPAIVAFKMMAAESSAAGWSITIVLGLIALFLGTGILLRRTRTPRSPLAERSARREDGPPPTPSAPDRGPSAGDRE